MPTGYTAKLYDGEESFGEFVMRCARAMGHLVSMREEDADAPIPEEFNPSPYHRDALAEATRKLAELRAITPERANAKAEEVYRKRHDRWLEEVAAKRARLDRFQAMVDKVVMWDPPTPGHVRFKAFMLEQLTISVQFDEKDPSEPFQLTGEEWLGYQLDDAEEAIEYHQRNWDEEVECCAERTEWVQQLRSSLKEPEVAV